jgi:hypothetical protein
MARAERIRVASSPRSPVSQKNEPSHEGSGGTLGGDFASAFASTVVVSNVTQEATCVKDARVSRRTTTDDDAP